MQVDEQTLKDYLAKMPKAGKCPLCRGDKVDFLEKVFFLGEYNPEKKFEGVSLPVMPLYCNDCGCVFFISPILAGFITANTD